MLPSRFAREKLRPPSSDAAREREREVLLIEKRQSNAFKRPQMDALVIDRHPQRYGCTHARKEERKLLVMMSHHCLID